MRLALFDLDDTLLTGDSDFMWVEFLIGRDAIPREPMHSRNDDISRRYNTGEISGEEYSRFYLSTLAGRGRDTLDALHQDFMRECVVPNIPQRALELLAGHRDRGDLIVLTTATNRFICEPIAAYLSIEHVIATEPEFSCEVFTGNVVGIPNMRDGKVKRLDTWLAERGYHWLDFAETWFYSDSRNDIPLLDRVSRPVAVDPDAMLADHAHNRGWPVLRLRTAE